MKNTFISLGIALAATLFLTDCTKQIENPSESESEGIPFEVSTVLTRTANDGMSTTWAKNDAINLFHAEAGTTDYSNDGKFAVDEGLTGTFSGTLATALDNAKSYDWYAVYPYNSYLKNPKSKNAALSSNAGLTIIGAAADKTQNQAGNDSKAHLCDDACPLYGTVTNAGASETPSFEMKNLASVICIEVTNTLDEALTVNTVAFTSSEDIVGKYYIDFTGSDGPVFTSQNVSSTASLNVTGGAAIAKDASAKFYLAIKPHTAASGSTLKLSVNGSEKTAKLTKDVTFNAGKIKTLKYSYATAATAASLPFEETFEAVDGTSETQIKNTDDFFTTNFASKFSSFSYVYQTKEDGGIVKLGGSSSKGVIVTNNLDLSKAFKVTINAKYWGTDTATKITVSDESGESITSDALTAEFQDYVFTFPAATASEKVTIAARIASKNRFYINNIKIEYAE
jgi:hypothetical protein